MASAKKPTYPTQTLSPVSAANMTIMRPITYRSISGAIAPHCDRFGSQEEELYVTRV